MGSPPEDIVSFTHRFSTYSQRVTIALREKGILYRAVFVDLFNKPQELLEANPIYGKVPTIVHRGIPVSDSLVILQYLDEAFPERVALMPKDAFERSKVRFWTDYIYKSFEVLKDKLQATIVQETTFEGPERMAYIKEMSNFLKTMDDAMTGFYKDGPFFTGEKFGYLDVVLAPLAACVLAFEMIVKTTFPGPDEIPRIHKWMDAISKRKSVKDTLPSNEEVLEYFKLKMERIANGERFAAAH